MKNQKILHKIKKMFDDEKLEFKSEDDRKHFQELIHAFEHHTKTDVDKIQDTDNE